MAYVTVSAAELEALRSQLDTHKAGLKKAKEELDKIRTKFGMSASVGRDMHDRWVIEKNCNDALSGKIRELRLEMESKNAELLWAREALAQERAKGRMPPRKRAKSRITVVEVPHVFAQDVEPGDGAGETGVDKFDNERDELVWLLSKAKEEEDNDDGAAGANPVDATTPPAPYSFLSAGAARSGGKEGVQGRLFP